jgi:hypothetical protein
MSATAIAVVCAAMPPTALLDASSGLSAAAATAAITIPDSEV